MTKLFNLPAHPLLVHAPIVLAPLLFLAILLVLVRPAWQGRQLWLLTGASAVLVVGMILATQSGEGLQEALSGIVDVDEHAELGETTRLLSLLLFVVVLAWAAVSTVAAKRRSVGAAAAQQSGALRVLKPALGVGALLLSLLVTFWTIRTGHEGAKVVWDGVLKP